MRRRAQRRRASEPLDDGDASASFAALVERAGPARIEFVDVEQAIAKLEPDDKYESALVVLCRSGVPVSSMMVDLLADTGEKAVHIRALAGISGASESHIRELFSVDRTDLPRISVVIPSIVSRVEELEICLKSMRDLDYPDYEVILVDNRREVPALDPLPGLIEGRPWMRVVRESRPGISAARNAGVANASGDVIAFTDDDVRVDRRWLRALGARFVLNPALGVVTGLILPAELETPAQVWFERYYGGFGGERSFESVTVEVDPSSQPILRGSRLLARNAAGVLTRRFSIYGVGAFGAGANMAFRRKTLATIGGFDFALGVGTPARGGEDLAALINVLWTGEQLGYEPAAFVLHRHRQEYHELLAQLNAYGLGFTAMLTSLMRRDPRHVLSILAQIPVAVKGLTATARERVLGARSETSSSAGGVALYPKSLYRSELTGAPRGPLAYFRSRKFWRDVSSLSPSNE
jgi:hypothetical protein